MRSGASGSVAPSTFLVLLRHAFHIRDKLTVGLNDGASLIELPSDVEAAKKSRKQEPWVQFTLQSIWSRVTNCNKSRVVTNNILYSRGIGKNHVIPSAWSGCKNPRIPVYDQLS